MPATAATRTRRTGGWQALLGALAVAALVLAGVAVVDASQRAKHLQLVRSDSLLYASVVRAKLEGALNKRLRIAYGMAAFARSQFRELPKGFYDFAEALMHSGVPGIRSLQLAPNAVVRYVYPYATNEKVIGHDLLADPARRDAVVRAIEGRRFVVAGPVKLLQGGSGIIARLPIYHSPDGDSAPDRFWGFSTIVMSVDPLLAEAGLGGEQASGYRVALRGIDGLGAEGGQFYGDAELFGLDPVLLDVALPAGSWQVAVVPRDGWPTTAPASQTIWLIGILLSLAAAVLTCLVLLAPHALRREVARATQALRDSEERFRSVAESANDAIVSADQDGRIIFWNRAAQAVFGHTAEEAIGQSINLLIPERFRSRHDMAMQRRANGTVSGPGRTIAAVGLRKDGSEFPLELTNAVWTAGGGTFFTAIFRDVSERKRFEREQAQLLDRYHQAQRLEAIGTLASGTAHEFNNILNAMMAHADTAAMLVEPGPAQQAILEVQEGAWRAAEIVRQLLVFSDEGRLECAEPVDLPALVEDLADELRHTLPPGVTLEVDGGDGGGEVLADHGQLAQALRNVCTNAIQALDDGGHVRLAVRRLDGPPDYDGEGSDVMLGEVEAWPAIAVSVRDDGCGMNKATLGRIFEPFFTTRAVGQGTGLGLAVVHGIMQRSGGAVRVHSVEGEGTDVTLIWPAALATARAADYSV